jgi:alanyl-tRNA synthetase
VGDQGVLVSANERLEITDTKKENSLIVHFTDTLPENPEASFRAIVDPTKRAHSVAHHSATHLLHQALRDVLGTHVEQKGSLVSPDYLRFDFSHFAKMTDEEVEKVEGLVNERIRKQYALEERRDVPIEEASKMGAMMLFGEKYGDKVRVIKFGDSIELCGGTHIANTGSIGFFKITSEGAVAAGIRRIEAIAGEVAFGLMKEEMNQLESLRQLLKSKDILKSVSDLQQKNNDLARQVEKLNKEKAGNVKKELASKFTEVKGVQLLVEKVDLEAAEIKDIAFQLKGEKDNMIAVFGSESGGKPTITVVISEELVKSKNLNASAIVRELAKEINGGGGGQAFFATAGGSKPEGLATALQKTPDYLATLL